MAMRLWLMVVVGGYCGLGLMLMVPIHYGQCKTKGAILSRRQVSSKLQKGVSPRPFPFWRVMSLRDVPPVQPNSISLPAMWPLVSVVPDWSEGLRTAVSTTKRWSRWFGRQRRIAHRFRGSTDRSLWTSFSRADSFGAFRAGSAHGPFQRASRQRTPRCRGWKLSKRCQRASSCIASHADCQHAQRRLVPRPIARCSCGQRSPIDGKRAA